MVENIETNPKEIKAGDEFDLILNLRNTSAKQYVQNIKLTLTPEEDALLPVSGSTSVYIEKIGKGESYPVKMRMKARPDLADKPVKIEISMEFEDKALTALTATQSMVLNVCLLYTSRCV